MLKLQRFTAFILLFFGVVSSAHALQVSPYTTASFTTTGENLRVVSILKVLSSSSVTFDATDGIDETNLEEALSSGILQFVICNAQQSCSSTIDSVLTQVAIPEGTIWIENNSIVFQPTDPSFEASVTFTYEVQIPQAEAFGASQMTINISSSSATLSNMKKVESTLSSYCESTTNETAINACLELASLSGAEQIEALSTISPEEVVAEFTSTINMTKDQTGNLSNRLNALRGGASGFSIAGLNYIQGEDVLYGHWLQEMANQVGGNASADQNFTPFGFFINGSITDGDKDSTDLETGYDLEGDSITLGMDYRFNESLVAGVAYGISNSEIDFSSNSEMENELDNLLFYGTWYKDQFYVDGMIGYAEGDLETERHILVGSIDTMAKGETESSQLFLSVTGNFDFTKDALTYGPYAAYDYIDGEIDGYDEIGTSGFEVSFRDQDIKSQVLTFGGRVSYAWSQPWGIVVPHGRFEWKTELEDDRDAIVGRFVLDTSGNTFSIEADDLDDSWFQAGLGVSATFQYGLSAYVDYEQVISYDDTDIQTWSFGGRWEAKF